MAHTFDNISFEDPDAVTLTASIDGEIFTPDAWVAFTVTNSVETYADFGASSGDFIESSERYEAHWTGLATFVEAYEEPVNPAELEFASFNTGINATAFEAFEREWDSNEDYLFGLGATGIAAFDPVTGTENFEDFEEEWGDNHNFDFVMGSTTAAAFDPVTGTEDFEDFEEEWNDNHNYDLVMGSTTTAMFEGGLQPLDDYEEVNLKQWSILVAVATGLADYTVTVEGEPITFTSLGSPTATTIRDGLVTALGGSSKPITVANQGSNALTIARDSGIQEPARNSLIPVSVTGPTAGDLTKSRVSQDEWTQTGQMATDP